MNNRQLTFAREFRGFSQTELANSIAGLSQSNLSKFEKGLDSLSENTQSKIIEFLGFPTEFFERKIGNTIENANYRKKATISKAVVQEFEYKCRLIGYIVDQMSEDIDWPPFTFAPLNVEEGFSPSYVANYNRKLCKLSADAPVKDIITIVEGKGVIVYELDAYEKFDGVSFITDNGFPIIIVNNTFSNDRKRFTIAHELGHLLLHNDSNFPVSAYRQKEKEANEFASEFLMPENEIKHSLRGLRLNDLGVLKQHWLTSMASLLRRAKDLNCIDENRYKYFLIEMSRLGYSKKEPSNVFIDEPKCFKSAYKLFTNELNYSNQELSKYFALPEDVLDEIFAFDKKLRVIR